MAADIAGARTPSWGADWSPEYACGGSEKRIGPRYLTKGPQTRAFRLGRQIDGQIRSSQCRPVCCANRSWFRRRAAATRYAARPPVALALTRKEQCAVG